MALFAAAVLAAIVVAGCGYMIALNVQIQRINRDIQDRLARINEINDRIQSKVRGG